MYFEIQYLGIALILFLYLTNAIYYLSSAKRDIFLEEATNVELSLKVRSSCSNQTLRFWKFPKFLEGCGC